MTWMKRAGPREQIDLALEARQVGQATVDGALVGALLDAVKADTLGAAHRVDDQCDVVGLADRLIRARR